MNIQIEIPTEGSMTPFIEYDSTASDFGDDPFSIGVREFVVTDGEFTGTFKYHWVLQGASREELDQFVAAAQRLLDIASQDGC